MMRLFWNRNVSLNFLIVKNWNLILEKIRLINSVFSYIYTLEDNLAAFFE